MRHGTWYKFTYTVGDNPTVHTDTLFLRDKDFISLEGSLMTMVARALQVNVSSIKPTSVVRIEQ